MLSDYIVFVGDLGYQVSSLMPSSCYSKFIKNVNLQPSVRSKIPHFLDILDKGHGPKYFH